jgi:hypothetical protein
LLDERKMAFTQNQPAPHERSIFRKHTREDRVQ